MVKVTKEQIDILVELQSIDTKSSQIESALREVPLKIEELDNDLNRYEQDVALIEELITKVASTPEEAFIKTEQIERCRFCLYRSLCDRGDVAEAMASLATEAHEVTDDWQDNFDFEQIAEVEW